MGDRIFRVSLNSLVRDLIAVPSPGSKSLLQYYELLSTQGEFNDEDKSEHRGFFWSNFLVIFDSFDLLR